MAPPAASTKARLRWALLIALALHAAVLWRYAPNLFGRFEVARQVGETPPAMLEAAEEVVEIAPPLPPPKGRGLAIVSSLAGGSPEALQEALPADFFPKPAAATSGELELADDLAFSRATGAEIVASIIPAAARLPQIAAISDRARSPKPRAGTVPLAKAVAPPLKAPAATVAAQLSAAAAQVPFLLPPVEETYDVDAAIARSAQAAEKTARDANKSELGKPAPDYRAMLPQGPLVAAPPLPLGGGKTIQPAERADPAAAPRPDDEPSGITTFALDAPVARDHVRAAPDQGRASPAARQQYFSQLTARLKATNQRVLAEAVKAGPRATVRMKFLVDRDGRVLEISPTEPVSRLLAERAAAVIRAAPLPPVPAAMTQVPVELSFPVEVYQ